MNKKDHMSNNKLKKSLDNFDIPRINFEEKPKYSMFMTSNSVAFRLTVFLRFCGKFLIVVFRTLYFGGFKSLLVNNTELVNPIINDGIFVSRLEESVMSQLEASISQEKKDLLSLRAKISKRSFSDNQSAISGNSLKESIKILDASEEVKKMLDMAKDWFSTDRISIAKLTLQVNDVQDNIIMSQAISSDGINTDYLHLDAAVGQLKFIVYMSDVEEANGPTSYVPGTNKSSGLTFRRLVGATVDNLGFSGDSDMARRGFMALPRFLRYKANFGNDLPLNCELSHFLLKNERKIIGPKGTIFLFDPSGVHRGGLLKESTRTILQIQIRIK